MIRIDEIYSHTFWPWIKNNLPLTRMFFCDPPGRSDPEALRNFGEDVTESNYIFLHDQEPIHLDIHHPLFRAVRQKNRDLNHGQGPTSAIVITSEQHSDQVQLICDKYGWRSAYYFFHGWAALDWYRGYDRTFLMPEPDSRSISRSFISPNRIVGGKRDHRILLMYHLVIRGVRNAWISFPRVCPAENQDVVDIAAKFGPEVQQTLAGLDLPWCFPGEIDHPMHSCWLSLFEENAMSLAHVVTETVYYGRRYHLTEKTFKPIFLGVPFVIFASKGHLDKLKEFGFDVFESIIGKYDCTNEDSVINAGIELSKVYNDVSVTQICEYNQKKLNDYETHKQIIKKYFISRFEDKII
jgi:hypothetical protein